MIYLSLLFENSVDFYHCRFIVITECVNVFKEIEPLSNDAPLSEGNTSGSVEGSMLQKELMELCTKYS